MAIGDIASTERGTGARFNDGKPPLDLIPLRVLAAAYQPMALTTAREAAWEALACLAEWQEDGRSESLYEALRAVGNPFHDIARVLEYGKRKYAAWNWSRGMPWSVVLGCAVRHLEWIIVHGEAIDKESGLPHIGHFGCNVVFLLTYERTYPEGDDRPRTLTREKTGPAESAKPAATERECGGPAALG